MYWMGPKNEANLFQRAYILQFLQITIQMFTQRQCPICNKCMKFQNIWLSESKVTNSLIKLEARWVRLAAAQRAQAFGAIR
jgi:hypothetical protein